MWSPDHEELRRVGVLLVLVAAVVGLAVLVLGRRASSQELLDPGLVAPQVQSPDARLESAEDGLNAERRHRVLELLDLGLRAGAHASPSRLLRTGLKTAWKLRDWNDRSEAEDRALDLLEGAVRSGEASPRAEQLYRELREREVSEQTEQLEAEFDVALERDDAARARRTLGRLRALQPQRSFDDQARRLEERRASAETPRAIEAVAPWEAALAAALLADHHGAVLRRAGPRADERLVRAVALQHTGQHDAAVAALEEVARGRGLAADTARAWLADPRIHPEGQLDELWDQAQNEQRLGLAGGEPLAKEGTSLSNQGYKAWRQALKPGNLLRGIPRRVLGDWRPEAREFRASASDFLRRYPGAARAAEVREQLASLGEPPASLEGAWRDGHFALPPARTGYAGLRPAQVLVHRDALGGAPIPQPREDCEGLVLWPSDAGSAGALLPGAVRELVYWLAAGLEAGELEDSRGSQGEMLIALQRLDSHVRGGGAVELVEWQSEQPRSAQVALALASGDRVQTTAAQLWRRKDELILQRRLLGSNQECPEDWRCMRRRPGWNADVYARIDTSGKFRLGARTSLAGVGLGVELSRWGPTAHLTLPVARWLGMEDRLPLETQVQLQLGGVSLTPQVDPTRESKPLSR